MRSLHLIVNLLTATFYRSIPKLRTQALKFRYPALSGDAARLVMRPPEPPMRSLRIHLPSLLHVSLRYPSVTARISHSLAAESDAIRSKKTAMEEVEGEDAAGAAKKMNIVKKNTNNKKAASE